MFWRCAVLRHYTFKVRLSCDYEALVRGRGMCAADWTNETQRTNSDTIKNALLFIEQISSKQVDRLWLLQVITTIGK